ncbi:hypothetical protein FXO38_24468 [Capsicum annuum]|nr:hypothetical protein FXO38_24468 [Capsicum annuum]KAF3640517.1 hypothetical protein FXO37_23425 [Capsicum annuum]
MQVAPKAIRLRARLPRHHASHRASIIGRAIIAGWILAFRVPRARGWPKCESISMNVAVSGGCNSNLFVVAAMAYRVSGIKDLFLLKHSDHDPRLGGITH